MLVYCTKTQLPCFLNSSPGTIIQCLPGCGYSLRVGKNEGGVNITRQHMQSRVLALVCSAMTRGPRCCSNEHGCLSRDLCCGISCHPSRVSSTLDCLPCHGVSYVIKLWHLEPHPPCVNFIIVGALFEGGVNFASHT